MVRTLRPLLLAIAVLGAGAGCASSVEPVAPATTAPVDTLAERDALEAAPESVAVDGTSLGVTSNVWLDESRATSRGAGRAIRVVTALRTPRGEGVPRGVQLARVYVLRGDDVWVSAFTADRSGGTRGVLEGEAQNGPAWRAGERVDVVVAVELASGETRFAARRDVTIAAAD